LVFLFCSALQFVAWQLDVGWIRRPWPLLPAIVLWSVVAFFLMSQTVIFLTFAVRAGSARFEVSAKFLGAIGLGFSGFLLEHLLKLPGNNLDTVLFRPLILQAQTSVPGRPVSQAGQTVTMLAVAASINDYLSKQVWTPNLKADLERRPWEINLPVGAIAAG
jgi:hypothetical protein